jgi:cytochrome c2
MSADEPTFYNLRRLHAAFAVSALALLAATIWALGVDGRRDWKQCQRTFHRQFDGAAQAPDGQPEIRQIDLPDFPLAGEAGPPGRTDRCPTCHLGIDRPLPACADLPEPYRSHPRLDLFVGEQSPHPLSRFGCTICHEGQGSATDFVWASHAPDSIAEQARWRRQYGWAPNPHWDFPMLSARFAESRCLPCHAEPLDLDGDCPDFRPPDAKRQGAKMGLSPSVERAAASKLLAGYRLVRQLGCTGCHEMGGSLPSPFGKGAGTMAVEPKVGPSLRHLAAKVDAAYLTDRIRDPASFLPDSAMPRMYGLNDHLAGQGLRRAREFEQIEVRAVAAYLLQVSEPLEPLPSPPGVAAAPSAQRGKQLFELGGCLACHRHDDFPQGTATQGPDLSRLGAKYRPARGATAGLPSSAGNTVGQANRGTPAAWLTSWIRDPAHERPQTAMPSPRWESPPSAGDRGGQSDPAADVAAYLLSRRSTSGPPSPWRGVWGEEVRPQEHEPMVGWVERQQAKRAPEPHQVLRDADGGARDRAAHGPSTHPTPSSVFATEPPDEKLADLGRLAIARRGCFGCHDIPGFDDARPIGPALSDWGRKPESSLGFEQVAEGVADAGEKEAAPDADRRFYLDALRAQRREGFLWQKLRAPRSFDFKIAGDKPYGQWLTMGQFNLTAAQREAIMTYVLGLAAEPAAPYVSRPEGSRRAIAEGRKVLEKYACAECHTLELARWTVRGRQGVAEVVGTPRVEPGGELLEDEDERGEPLYYFMPWEPAVLDGRTWPAGGAELSVSRPQLLARRPPRGGTLGRLLYPRVLARAREAGAAAPEAVVWGWLPPALVGEGAKVQAPWLRDFLLEPAAIRPAAVLHMPRFNFSEKEVAAAIAYFAAVAESDSAAPRPAAADRKDRTTVNAPQRLARMEAAMEILTDRNTYCGRCHALGQGDGPRAGPPPTAPNLEDVGRRIQPDYIRRWLANPKSILPYTVMPVNFPSAGPPLGKVGTLETSAEQLEAVVDLLVYYDWYLRRRSSRGQ